MTLTTIESLRAHNAKGTFIARADWSAKLKKFYTSFYEAPAFVVEVSGPVCKDIPELMAWLRSIGATSVRVTGVAELPAAESEARHA